MKSKQPNHLRSIVAHIVLLILSFMCLFFFYILIVNATRSHAELQKGFSALPGAYMLDNLKNVENVSGDFKQSDRFRMLGGNLYILFGINGIWFICI